MIDYARLEADTEALKQRFREAKPFPWIMVDDFLTPGSVAALAEGFEAVMTRGHKDPDAAKKHTHVLRKRGMVRTAMMERPHLDLLDELASERFVSLVSEITGIAPLYADPELVGGGLHEIFPGGYLNIHTDFNFHPTSRRHRRLNILIYLNENWRPEWKGSLELWPEDNSGCAVAIEPVAGRMVLFETSEISFHGHPAPLACPDGVTRKSIAAYYYSDWPRRSWNNWIWKRSKTNYRLTPQQSAELATKIADLRAAKRSKREIVEALSVTYQAGDIWRGLRASR